MKTVQDFMSKNLGDLQTTLLQDELDLIYLSNQQNGSVVSGYANGEQSLFLKVGGKVLLSEELQAKHREQQEEIREIKEECSQAINQFIVYFNNEMTGTPWNIQRNYFKQSGNRRSLLQLSIPNAQPYADQLDKNGNTDLATPGELLALMAILQHYQDEIFRAKLSASLNQKVAKTVRGQKI
ncbi:hypothetical protein [Burkholderia metallica]|uniref:hypothetical protein n=1 Tax=Burkholderia metallica TaxID=488729 RepID=UPI00158E950C|nr:hypothetical protein [Burkholderia metallica]